MNKTSRTISKRDRWCSAMELLNAIVPGNVSHQTLVGMSRGGRISGYKFRPMINAPDNVNRCVRDIVEFLREGVRFIIFDNEDFDPCLLLVEFFDPEDNRHLLYALRYELEYV